VEVERADEAEDSIRGPFGDRHDVVHGRPSDYCETIHAAGEPFEEPGVAHAIERGVVDTALGGFARAEGAPAALKTAAAWRVALSDGDRFTPSRGCRLESTWTPCTPRQPRDWIDSVHQSR